MILRPFQQTLKNDIYSAWQNPETRNVIGVLPTGGGKTFTFSSILKDFDSYKCAIAHRQELVSQISLSLATCGVMHRIIAPKPVIRWIVSLHIEELGQSFYNPSAPCGVIGVDTLIKRHKDSDVSNFIRRVGLWVIDEAHHVLKNNKWGKAVGMFKNAYGLGVTATPCRADGKGLGAHADGVFHQLIQGPTMRELINMGYLCNYRIFAPPSDLMDQLNDDDIGSTGDYKQPKMREASRKSHIVGDVVSHYMRIAPGKLGITFVTDVETARETAAEFRSKGVPAEVLHANVKDSLRVDIMRRLKRREIHQIVNVDILGEGVDVPAVEVVSFARPTKSYSLYAQQFGRALRTSEGKEHAIIIDHVNNVDVTRGGHGLPDARRYWTLNRRERKKKEKDPDVIPVRACQVCTAIYEMIHKSCPYCGHVHEPIDRSKPEYVDGDLTELDQNTLAAMRGEVDRMSKSAEELKANMLRANMSHVAASSAAKSHRERHIAHNLVRESIAWWRGHYPELTDSQAFRKFYFTFDIDVLTAQTLPKSDAEQLAIRINKNIDGLVNGR